MTTSTTHTAPATLAELAGTWTIDASHTRIGFVARHAMVTKVRGAFNEFEGSAISTGRPDQVLRQGRHQGRQHRHPQRAARRPPAQQRLPGLDEHPEITFVSSSVRPTGDTSLEVTGDLTIRGVTREVTIDFEYEGAATDPFGNLRAGFEGSLVINRKDYGVNWNAALEAGGVLVSEKVTLEFEVSAIKSA